MIQFTNFQIWLLQENPTVNLEYLQKNLANVTDEDFIIVEDCVESYESIDWIDYDADLMILTGKPEFKDVIIKVRRIHKNKTQINYFRNGDEISENEIVITFYEKTISWLEPKIKELIQVGTKEFEHEAYFSPLADTSYAEFHLAVMDTLSKLQLDGGCLWLGRKGLKTVVKIHWN
jgi:hypothetical protein